MESWIEQVDFEAFLSLVGLVIAGFEIALSTVVLWWVALKVNPETRPTVLCWLLPIIGWLRVLVGLGLVIAGLVTPPTGDASQFVGPLIVVYIVSGAVLAVLSRARPSWLVSCASTLLLALAIIPATMLVVETLVWVSFYFTEVEHQCSCKSPDLISMELAFLLLAPAWIAGPPVALAWLIMLDSSDAPPRSRARLTRYLSTYNEKKK